MKKFIYTYVIMLVVLFGVLYWNISPIAVWLNYYQTQMTLFFLDMGLAENQLKGVDIMINSHYKVIVTQACNGMIPYLVLLASIIAYSSNIKHKIVWAFMGYVAVSVVNLIRLWVVVYFVMKTPSNFELSHDFFGNFLLMVTGLGLFYLFLRGTRKHRTIS